MVLALALDIATGRHDPAQLDALAMLAGQTQGVDADTMALLRDLKQASGDEEALRSRASQAIRKAFLGGF